ncbi:MAG: CpsB/CapC family capsule biosynthesis tyrosine phosphatase [Myxococcota bacterium]
MFGLFRKKARPSHDGTVALRPRDCHSHVIPGVDDGSRTMDESLQMLRMLGEQGATHVIATPHIYPGRFDNETDPLRRAFDGLQEQADGHGDLPTLELGAEHYLDDALLPRVEANDLLAFGAERYVLFETPTGSQTPEQLLDVCFALVDRGYTPLMAHVERYRYLRNEAGAELLEDLRAAGAKFQVNRTPAARGKARSNPRSAFISTLQARGWVDEVGSDMHRPTASGRPETLKAA